MYSIVYSKIPAKLKIFCQNLIAHKDRLHVFFVLFSELFISVSQCCVAVLCCRMSPLQKAQVRVAFNLKIFYIAEAERIDCILTSTEEHVEESHKLENNSYYYMALKNPAF